MSILTDPRFDVLHAEWKRLRKRHAIAGFCLAFFLLVLAINLGMLLGSPCVATRICVYAASACVLTSDVFFRPSRRRLIAKTDELNNLFLACPVGRIITVLCALGYTADEIVASCKPPAPPSV